MGCTLDQIGSGKISEGSKKGKPISDSPAQQSKRLTQEAFQATDRLLGWQIQPRILQSD